MGKLALKFGGKAGTKLAEEAGAKLAEEAGEKGILKGLTKLWGKAAETGVKAGEEAGEVAAKNLAKELAESTAHKEFVGAFSREVRETTNGLYKALSGAEAQAESIIKGSDEALNKITKQLSNTESFSRIIATKGKSINMNIPEDILTNSNADQIKQYILNQAKKGLGNVDQAKAQLFYIERAKNILNEPDGLEKFVDLLDAERKSGGGFFGSGLENKIPNLRNMMDKVKDVRALDSSALGDTQFVQKALKLKTDDPEGFKLFISNPKNYARWDKMRSSRGFVGDLIEKGSPRISLKRSIVGITPMETAKRIGLGGAISAAAAGAMKIYNWFAGNDPEKVSSSGRGVIGELDSIQTSPEGQAVLTKLKNSLNNIASLADKANSGLATEDAPQVTEQYIQGIGSEMVNVKDALGHWNSVAQGSANPEAANRALNKMGEFFDKIGAGFSQLQSQFGESGVAGKGEAVDENISKIQKFLRIPETGRLDEETISTLRQLEQDFNRRAGSLRFTGAFVVPEVGHVAPYDDIIKAYQKIQKY